MLEDQVYVYNFEQLDLKCRFETDENPNGLVALSASTDNCVLGTCARALPHIFVVVFSFPLSDMCVCVCVFVSLSLVCPGTHGLTRIQLFNRQMPDTFIQAHQGPLAQLALTPDGTRLATASTKGTLIRIWDTATQRQLQEVRRGTENATIYSIAFSPDVRYFCCTSSRGTCHIFASNELRGFTGPILLLLAPPHSECSPTNAERCAAVREVQ